MHGASIFSHVVSMFGMNFFTFFICTCYQRHDREDIYQYAFHLLSGLMKLSLSMRYCALAAISSDEDRPILISISPSEEMPVLTFFGFKTPCSLTNTILSVPKSSTDSLGTQSASA